MRAAKKALELYKRDNSQIVVFHSVIHKLTDLRPTLESGPGMILSYKIPHETLPFLQSKIENTCFMLFHLDLGPNFLISG